MPSATASAPWCPRIASATSRSSRTRTICATSADAMSMSPIWRSASTTWSDGASATAPELVAALADVDPFRLDQFGQALGIDAKGTAGRAGGGDHLVEGLERDVAIDRQRRRQPEGTDAAHRMAGDRGDLLRCQHPQLAAKGPALTFLLSSRAMPLVTSRRLHSFTRNDRVLAICAGATP